MENAVLTKQMLNMLSECVGKKFVSYEAYVEIDGTAFGNIRFNFDDFKFDLELMNHDINFIGGLEEVVYFEIKLIDSNEKLIPYICNAKTQVIDINETLKNIFIVKEKISLKNENYEILFDRAIVFETDNHKYVFAIDWHFTEDIIIEKDKTYDEIKSIDDEKENWIMENDTKDNVHIERTTIKI